MPSQRKTWRKGSHLWIPACFLAVAALLAWLAVDSGGAYLLLLWPSADCAAVGCAYFGLGARVFGKRRDGSLAPAAALPMLPFLLVIWLVWHLQVLLSREACWSEPAPGLFLGRWPRRGEHPPGVLLVIDLTCEFPKPAYHPASAAYRCLPTLDAFIPEHAAFWALVEEAAAAPSVFVHCANGHGRSAAFAAAVLIRRGLASGLDEAMALIVGARPACRINAVQEALARKEA